MKRLEQKKPPEFGTRINCEEIYFCIIDNSGPKLCSAAQISMFTEHVHTEHGIDVFFHFGEECLKLVYGKAISHISTGRDKIHSIENLRQIK